MSDEKKPFESEKISNDDYQDCFGSPPNERGNSEQMKKDKKDGK